MKKTILTFIIITFLLVSCSTYMEGPKKVYHEFDKYCTNGDESSAQLIVSQEWVQNNEETSICSLLPIQYGKAFQGDPFRLDDPEPKVEIHGGIALLKWWSGNLKIVMIMDETDDTWKIRKTTAFLDETRE